MTSRVALLFVLTLAACASSTTSAPDVVRADAPTADAAEVSVTLDVAAPPDAPDVVVSPDALDVVVSPDVLDAAVLLDAPEVDPCGGLARCDGVCRDIDFDPRHCGRCGNACAAAEECIRGACVMAPCIAPQIACEGVCVDAATDRRHCGGCGCACPAGAVCAAGSCVVGCPAGLTTCGRITCGSDDAGAPIRCVDLGTDNLNCGMCGNACPDAQPCSAGRCVSR